MSGPAPDRLEKDPSTGHRVRELSTAGGPRDVFAPKTLCSIAPITTLRARCVQLVRMVRCVTVLRNLGSADRDRSEAP